MRFDWKQLRALAAREIEGILADLPGPLRERAVVLPVTFQPTPNRLQVADGIEPDTLGLFVGPEIADELSVASPVPAQIILFLQNIWEMAGGEMEVFKEEVHTTYLHELGHYLGLNEDDLMERGLE